MYKKMLVPLDGSELAEAALPYAKELAERLNLDLTLLNICEPHKSESRVMCQAYIEHAVLKIRGQSKGTPIKTGVKPINVEGQVISGNPAEEIINYANKNNIDLILIAAHDRSEFKRWIMGSVADKVLRTSRVPIWLVRAAIPEGIVHDDWFKRTMLVLLDGSSLAEKVLPHVETIAKQRGAEQTKVVLLRVFEEPSINADYPQAIMNLTWEEHVRRIREHFKNEAEQYLMGVQERLIAKGLNVSSEVHLGNPVDKIIDYTNKIHPNLIVMASHGSGISRWEYGNIADKILHGVSSPILLVRVKLPNS